MDVSVRTGMDWSYNNRKGEMMVNLAVAVNEVSRQGQVMDKGQQIESNPVLCHVTHVACSQLTFQKLWVVLLGQRLSGPPC